MVKLKQLKVKNAKLKIENFTKMNTKKIILPKNFLWGTSSSAHQVEGGNKNDWTKWEKKNAKRLAEEASKQWENWQQGNFPEMFQKENYISGQAADHYNRFEEDFALAKQLGHNAHRFSIEWSRVEPEKGVFNEKELRHYSKVFDSLAQNGMEPFVTLWHWTLPLWLQKEGGILSEDFPAYFERFTEKVVSRFKNRVKFWITLNEPSIVVSNAYLRGIWPPQKKCPREANRAFKNLATSHNLAYDKIKEINPELQVGLANNMLFVEPKYKFCIVDQVVVKIFRYISNEKFYRLTQGKHDFLGLNYYFHRKIRFTLKNHNENKALTDLGWEIYPEGIYHIIKEAVKYSGNKNIPVYITENGLADRDDSKRLDFVLAHIKQIKRAIKEGYNVKGYFYWSLTDNFEWDKGFWPRFGLIEIDYKTQKRTIRESAKGLRPAER